MAPFFWSTVRPRSHTVGPPLGLTVWQFWPMDGEDWCEPRWCSVGLALKNCPSALLWRLPSLADGESSAQAALDTRTGKSKAPRSLDLQVSSWRGGPTNMHTHQEEQEIHFYWGSHWHMGSGSLRLSLSSWKQEISEEGGRYGFKVREINGTGNICCWSSTTKTTGFGEE